MTSRFSQTTRVSMAPASRHFMVSSTPKQILPVSCQEKKSVTSCQKKKHVSSGRAGLLQKKKTHVNLLTRHLTTVLQHVVPSRVLQEYLTHKKTSPLQQACAYGPMVFLGVRCFLVSEKPLYLRGSSGKGSGVRAKREWSDWEDLVFIHFVFWSWILGFGIRGFGSRGWSGCVEGWGRVYE